MNKSDIEQKMQRQTREGGSKGSIKTYNGWQLFFLDRLHRLSLLNKDAESGNLDEFETKLVRYAIFSTLLDCTKLGIEQEARQLVSPDMEDSER